MEDFFKKEGLLLATIVSAMVVQFMSLSNKTLGTLLIFLASSFIVFSTVVPAVIDIFNAFSSYKITSGSHVERLLYATGALISVELISIMLRVLPKGMATYLKAKMGVEDASK